jgi:DNA-binding Xre family transcriptional regulator
MTLLERIDMALHAARKSRGDLAHSIGLSVQAISNLKRRPRSTLRPENVARAARFLACDLYWLCTGEGTYKAAERRSGHSFLAEEVARWFDSMQETDRMKAFALMYQMKAGNWSALQHLERRSGARAAKHEQHAEHSE